MFNTYSALLFIFRRRYFYQPMIFCIIQHPNLIVVLFGPVSGLMSRLIDHEVILSLIQEQMLSLSHNLSRVHCITEGRISEYTYVYDEFTQHTPPGTCSGQAGALFLYLSTKIKKELLNLCRSPTFVESRF